MLQTHTWDVEEQQQSALCNFRFGHHSNRHQTKNGSHKDKFQTSKPQINIYISHVPHQILLQIINKLWSFILNHDVIILVHSVLSQHFKPKDQAGNAYLPPYHDAIFGFWPIIIYILLYFFDKGFWQFQTTANGVVRGLSKITWLKF